MTLIVSIVTSIVTFDQNHSSKEPLI